MSKGILEQINDSIKELNENVKLMTAVLTEKKAAKAEEVKEEQPAVEETPKKAEEVKEEQPAVEETPKKAEKKSAQKKAEPVVEDTPAEEKTPEPVTEEVNKEEVKEPDKAEAEQADPPENLITDDDLKKVVRSARDRNSANFATAHNYLKERGLKKLMDIAQEDRQAFVDYMESL